MFRSITVAVDGSESGASALAFAIDLARIHGAELVVLAVAPVSPVFTGPNEPFVPSAVPVSPLPEYRAIVDEAVARAKEAGVASVTGVCEDGVVVDEILGHLKDHPADLLVVGSRGLTGAKRLLLGSVSAALVGHAPCPVLVVRPKVTTPSSA